MIGKDALFDLAKALEGLPIIGCLRATPAALAGLRYGDILLSVNGRRTRTFIDYLEAKGLRGDGMSVVIFRAGYEHPLELEYRAQRRGADPLAVLAELIEMNARPGELDSGTSGS